MLKRIKKIYPYLAILWLSIVLGISFLTIKALVVEKRIQGDLLALFPNNDKRSALKYTQKFIENTKFSQRFVILLGHEEQKIAKTALCGLRKYIRDRDFPIEEQISTTFTAHYKDLFKNLYPFRAGLLAHDDRENLLQHNGNLILERALMQMALPFSTLGSPNIAQDPFFLFPSFVQSLLPESAVFTQDEDQDIYVTYQGVNWYIFHAQLVHPVFSIPMQEKMSAELIPFLAELKKAKSVEVLKTGAVFYSMEGFKQANAEISTIGFFSTLAIIALVLLFFRSFKPLFLAIIVIFSGLIGGIFSCLTIFDSIHIIALLFGCSLVGIVVDYVIHYFCSFYKKEVVESQNRFSALKSLMPAIVLGALSSAAGYAILAIVPFPGIQQMAILGSTGIMFGFISLAMWAPYLAHITVKKQSSLFLQISIGLTKIAKLGQNKKVRWATTICCCAMFVAGSSSISFDDDIRNFQSLNSELKKEECQIKSLIPLPQSSQFLVVQANTLEELLQREEEIVDYLRSAQATNPKPTFKALCQLIPSKKRQKENRELLQKKLYEVYWESFAKLLGVNSTASLNEFGFENSLLEFDLQKILALPEGWREFIYYTPQKEFIGFIPVCNICGSISFPGVFFIDPMVEYRILFQSYRYVIMMLGMLIFVVIASILSLIHGFMPTLKIIFPVILSILATIGCIGISGTSFTLFHTMGTLLVFCMGIDYALFLYWRKNDSGAKKTDSLLLANILCALTTLLSFGCLAFTQTKAVSDFGLYIFIGIMFCFLNTTIFLGIKKDI